jgi:hypothetical protein
LGQFWSAEFREKVRKILTSELPFERSGSGFPVILKFEEAPREAVAIGYYKLLGASTLRWDKGEVIDLIEPTGVNRGMHEGESAIAVASRWTALTPR